MSGKGARRCAASLSGSPALRHCCKGSKVFTDPLTLILLFAGTALVLASMLVPKLVRPPRSKDDDSPMRARQAELRSLERVEDGVVELEETARELFGRMDTRARVLIHLIEEADASARKIETMQAGKK